MPAAFIYALISSGNDAYGYFCACYLALKISFGVWPETQQVAFSDRLAREACELFPSRIDGYCY
jgi:hypothetical protein